MTDFLLLAFIFLIAGVITVPVASRLGLGSVLGYLIAGIAISPVLALLHVDVVSIQHFAEFGVVMMLFLVGLEFEPKLLWSMRVKLLELGGGQVALTTGAVMAVAMFFGQVWSVGRSAIEALGHSRDQAKRIVEAFNDSDRRIMITAAEHYDPAIPAHENESYLAKVRKSRVEWDAD